MASLLRLPITHHGGLMAVFPRTSDSGAVSFQSLLLPAVSSTSSIKRFAISRPRKQDIIDAVEDADIEKDIQNKEQSISENVAHLVDSIRSMLNSMDDGEINVSPYDTAWVALVEDINNGGGPQFPLSLEWISNNQIEDGSWGDAKFFSVYDRVINTLACVVALRSWNLHPEQCNKGITFIKENMSKLADENEEHMTVGFEVVLPSLIERAKMLDIEIPYDSPALKEIYAKRDLKLTRIPMDMMHQVTTSLLHSLEGFMSGLNWEKLLKLRASEGSFLFSPSSTAFALQQTKDKHCLNYLSKCVQKFNGGVPCVYPVDMFAHLWAVDRLQRLGISRYFQTEIEKYIAYVYSYWTDKGICWARNSEVGDIDDTAMGFRLLRLYGYEVTQDVFKHFEKDGKFFGMVGQLDQSITGMYNLYKAAEVMFPGEEEEEGILAQARNFSANFLHEKRAKNELFDKWIITKDLPGEVGYALDIPFYASLPRLEARFYLEQYGGDDDVWIGKTLYRMPNVNNNIYLELAKLDYNNCQAIHQMEWKSIQKWYRNFNLGEFGLSEKSLLKGYYLAAANVFEPEKSHQRLAWAKTTILLEIIESHLPVSREQKNVFASEFDRRSTFKYTNGFGYKSRMSLVETLLRTLNQLSLDILLEHGTDINQKLNHAWQKWLKTWEQSEELINEGTAELLVSTLNIFGGYLGFTKTYKNKNTNNKDNDYHISCDDDEKLSFSFHPKYQQLLRLTNRICHQLQHNTKVDHDHSNGGGVKNTCQIETDMQELLQLVLTKSSEDLDSDVKENFLRVVRSFYYAAYCSRATMCFHMNKVLFQRVL